MRKKEEYDEFAPNYDKNVRARGYVGPEYMVSFLLELVTAQKTSIVPHHPATKVLDVGCGTGLVGKALKREGFLHLDGIDYSQGMLLEAYQTKAYQTLIGWCDLNKELPFFLLNQYDITICCGVFALDFVKPEALNWLIRVTKPGGLIIMNTKTTYCNTYDFEGYYKKMEQMKHLKLIEKRMNKPYLGNEADAHYWAFSIPNTQKKILTNG